MTSQTIASSLDLHFGELLPLISSLGDNLDLIALSEIETKLGYEFKHKSPTLSRGGVGLIHRNMHKLIDRDDLIIEPKQINNQNLELTIWRSQVAHRSPVPRH